MADTVEEVYVWDGTSWVPVVRDDCDLPINSSDDTVTLDGAANTFTVSTGGQEQVAVTDAAATFSGQVQTDKITSKDAAATDAAIQLGANLTVSTGNGGQIQLEPGTSSNHYLRVYDEGSPYGAMLCSRNSANAGFTVRPFKETVSGDYYRAYSVIWDYVAAERDFTNATNDFVLSSYNASSPFCKGDNYFAFNVGGLGNDTDFTLAAAFHANVGFNAAADKDAYNFYSTGTASNRFESELQVPKVVGLAANDAAIELGAHLTVKAGGRNQFRAGGSNCIRTLHVGSESLPALAISDTTTGFFFAPDDSNQYDTNTSGVAFTIANANQGVAAREVLRFQRNGQIVLAEEPTQPNSIATKQTVDDKIWVGTTAEYNAITKNPTTLYCLTD